MGEAGYSTIVDAVMFLAMVSVCALVLSAAISGSERQSAVAGSSLRSVASLTLVSMETVKIDRFEYRILGDQADAIAEKCGIDPGAWLYRDMTAAVLGRGDRHKPVMEIAAEAAACQFTLRPDNRTIKLNPLTGDYGHKARGMVDGFLKERLDGRFAYHFSLRWVPFADVPFEGSISCGDPEPPGAASASAIVTLPYRTGLTRDRVEEAIDPDLADIENATNEYRARVSGSRFKERVRASLGSSLENVSRPMADEVLGNTLYETIPANDAGNPFSILAAFSDNDSTRADPLTANANFDVEDTLCRMIALHSSGPLDRLTGEIVTGVEKGSIGPEEEREMIVRWMASRYNPSMARATLSVWVKADA